MKAAIIIAVSLAWGLLGAMLLQLSFSNAVMALAMIDGLAWLLILVLLLDNQAREPIIE